MTGGGRQVGRGGDAARKKDQALSSSKSTAVIQAPSHLCPLLQPGWGLPSKLRVPPTAVYPQRPGDPSQCKSYHASSLLKILPGSARMRVSLALPGMTSRAWWHLSSPTLCLPPALLCMPSALAFLCHKISKPHLPPGPPHTLSRLLGAPPSFPCQRSLSRTITGSERPV